MVYVSAMKRDLSIKQEHARFLGALFITTVASHTSSMMDAAIGGYYLGENVVSSINLVLPIEEIFYSLTLLLGLGACTAAAKAFGEGETERVRKHFTAALVSALTLFCTLAAVLFIMRESVLDILCGESYLREETGRYLISILLWFIISNVDTIMCEFVAMTGKPVLVAYCTLAYFCTKLLINWLFVGIFSFGIEGLGYASLISSLITLAILLSYCLSEKSPLRFIRSSFRQIASFTRTNIHYGKGLMAVEVSYILFSFAMNTLVLRYMGEKGFFCWSIVMMLFLVGDFAAAAAQETCLSLGGKYLGAGEEKNISIIFGRSMLFSALWIFLSFALVYVLPDFVLPLLGAPDHSNYAMLQSVIAMTITVTAGINLINLYLVRLVLQDHIRLFTRLIILLYLSVPLFFIVAHYVIPGHEWWGIVALAPIQAAVVAVSWRGFRSFRRES